MLNPALARVWRDPTTLQIGADAARAVVIAGMTPARASLLSRLDGSLTRAQALDAGACHGLCPAEVAHLLELLARAGVLVDGGDDRRPLVALTTAERDRLAPDLAAWSCRAVRRSPAEDRERDPAGSTLARRRRALVGIRGAGRVGATLVGLLAAAGVGQLAVRDPKPMRGYDVVPGGGGPSAARQTRAEGAIAAARTMAPATRFGARTGGRADIEVLCPDGPYLEPAERDQLLADSVPHLLATTYELVGIVGPLVVPGCTPCLRCLDLHRVDRDRNWPLVCAQLATPGRALAGAATVAACDIILATAVAAHAAGAVLAYLDSPNASPDLAGAEIELRPPLGLPRRRTWGIHPACGCGWASTPTREAG